jgi:Domain of unknown function (DUF4399)
MDRMLLTGAIIGLTSFLLSVIPASPQDSANHRTPAASGARVYFLDLNDGATIPAQSKIRFGVSGIDIVPAGKEKPNSGHHHLLIDVPLPPLDQPIPSDFNHLHFGKGQSEVDLTLAPGNHTLQLLLGDHQHIPHDPPVFSDVVHVHVDAPGDDMARTPSPPGAKVFFIEPHDGATVASPVTVKFGIEAMEVAPAGESKPNSGHHHLLVDTALPALDREIPSDLNHLHFGRGQTQTTLTLPPGEHTLQLLLGDYEHIPHDPPVMSSQIKIRVVEGAATGAPPSASHDHNRKPSPQDAVVYFIYPHDGDVIYPNSTIRFGLRHMGVAPAGIDRPNTGHHHLLVDVDTPPLDQPIPSDFNHIHLGNGQTEKKITLTPGEHTLQLIFADDQHLPHDPPVVSERIRVMVKDLRHEKQRK